MGKEWGNRYAAYGRENTVLSLVDIFEPLSEEEIKGLNGELSDIHLESGEIFYTPEDRSEKLFLLQKGRVRVYKTADGRELTLAIVKAERWCSGR